MALAKTLAKRPLLAIRGVLKAKHAQCVSIARLHGK